MTNKYTYKIQFSQIHDFMQVTEEEIILLTLLIMKRKSISETKQTMYFVFYETLVLNNSMKPSKLDKLK